MRDIDEMRSRDLEDLLREAWDVRLANFGPRLVASTPSAKTYVSDHHQNRRGAFVNVSVTGGSCALNCEHCNAQLLKTMEHVNSGGELKALADKLAEAGCEGLLISGGATRAGEVPLEDFYDAMPQLKQRGLKVLVHTGLATRQTARRLRQAGVDQVLLDIIGDEETIKQVYHLDRTPQDFLESLQAIMDEGLDAVPHIVIGLHFGKIAGEYRALDIVRQAKAPNLVLVILAPSIGTQMESVLPPPPEDIGRIAAIARILNPGVNLTLGCARPPGEGKRQMEGYAVRAGINGIAYPSDETVEFARSLGLEVVFKDTCCSLL